MKPWHWLLVGVVFLTGCAAIKQGFQDAQAGKTTPLAAGEPSPTQQAHGLLDPLTSLPYAGPVIPFLVPIAGLFYAWRRGRRLRLNLPPKALNPALSTVANVLHGVFEVGPDNSGLKRGWKVLLSLGISAFFIPAVQQWVVAHPQDATLFASVAAVIAGVEKELSKITTPQPPVPTVGVPLGG